MRDRMEQVVPPLVGGLVLLVALVSLIGVAIRDPRPHDIAVGMVGPAPAVQQLKTAFASAAPGAFAFTGFGSEADARAALDARAVDGYLVIGPGGPRLVVAGAAGDTVTGVMTTAFGNAFRAQGATVTVETVHPFASGDPHGLILFFVVVAVLVSTLVAQALAMARGAGAGLGTRVGVLVAFAVLAALAGMGTAVLIAGDYGSGFWAATAVVALGSAAVGAVVAGCARLLGPPGIGLAGLIAVLLALVTSGGPVGSQLLPDAYRVLAPWLPAQPLYSGIRGALYFDGAGVAGPALALTGWLVAGLVLLVAGEAAARRRRPVARPA